METLASISSHFFCEIKVFKQMLLDLSVIYRMAITLPLFITFDSILNTTPPVTTVSASGLISEIGSGSSGMALPPITALPMTGSSLARCMDFFLRHAAFFFFFSSAFSFSCLLFAAIFSARSLSSTSIVSGSSITSGASIVSDFIYS